MAGDKRGGVPGQGEPSARLPVRGMNPPAIDPGTPFGAKASRLTPYVCFLLLLALVWAAGAGLRGRHREGWDPAHKRTRVLTTIFPLYDLAREVGGDRAEVRNLLPPGVDPHEYALSPQDVALVAGADVILANGGVDDFIVAACERAGVPRRRISTLREAIPEQRNADSHLWLDPVYASQYAQAICSVMLSQRGDWTIQPIQREARAYPIEDHRDRLVTELKELDADYRKELAPYRGRAFIAFHEAFGHLAARYGLRVAAVWEKSPGREPSPREVAGVLRTAREQNVRALFAEPQFSPRAIEMIAHDAGLPVYRLDPVETAVDYRTTHYMDVMRRNLDVLKKALR